MLIDTHIHLNDEDLIGDIDTIVSNFTKDGIECALNVGYDFPSSKLALEQANKYDKLYALIGIHPHDSETACKEYYDEFIQMAQNNKVVGIGEIGLDYFRENSPRESQKKAFKEQIELANYLKLPIMLHIRESYEDTINILKDMKSYLNNGVQMHCYSGSQELVKVFNKFDCYYSFGGAITFKNARKNIEALRVVPIDRLLTETDCPYMAPVPLRGTRNEPKNVNFVVDKMVEVLGKEREELIEITNKNAKTLYRKIK